MRRKDAVSAAHKDTVDRAGIQQAKDDSAARDILDLSQGRAWDANWPWPRRRRQRQPEDQCVGVRPAGRTAELKADRVRPGRKVLWRGPTRPTHTIPAADEGEDVRQPNDVAIHSQDQGTLHGLAEQVSKLHDRLRQ